MNLHEDRIALKVLVVEDCNTNRRMLENFLVKLRHKVFMAADGAEAVRLFEHERPDIVLMDVMMPNMNGHEATRSIKQLAGDTWVPVVMVSALVTPEYLVQGLDAGADDYLPKPLNFRVLDAKMRAFERTLALQRRVGETLRRTRVITDNVVDAIVTIAADGRILSCNPATERVFGHAEEEVLGQEIGYLLREQSDEFGLVKPFEMSDRRREVVGVRRDGSCFPAELGMSRSLLDGQQIYIAILHDISEQRHTERLLRENASRLQSYHDAAEEENALARKIMAKQLLRDESHDPHITAGVEAAANFSGDVTLSTRSREGRLYCMLADATGHGLAAAISIMPAIPVFYTMADRDLPLSVMIEEMNTTLRRTLPAGRFVAAVLVRIDLKHKRAEVWNGGMPDCLWFDQEGNLVRKFISAHLPLGIISNEDLGTQTVEFAWPDVGQMVLCSDGVVEAESPKGEPMGTERLAQVLREAPPAKRYTALRAAVRRHIGGQPAHDDASIMIIDCGAVVPA